ncbi:hypothetical protein GCM10009850_083850 [Nonomuraea monospora]|uniref:Uncharacterized protein n=1 Tax=Nonomuraea monospora TaxID=568818 RepID=A0ABN3CTZ3_9ACTN
MTPTDGNAAAGTLAAFFGRDMTTAHGLCAACDRHAPLAEALVYGPAAGTALHCRSCGNLLMTMIEAPGGIIGAMPGLTRLDTRPAEGV